MMSADQVIVKAYHQALIWHGNQKRKGSGLPYMVHPAEVARILTECGIEDPMTIVTGILHDTIEDTSATEEDLRKEFGPIIASLVMEVTDDKSLPKVERKRRQVESMSTKSPAAQRVKMADKISNMGDLHNPPEFWTPEKVRGYVVWSWAIVRQCGHIHTLYYRAAEVVKSLGVDPGMPEEDFQKELDAYYDLTIKEDEMIKSFA